MDKTKASGSTLLLSFLSLFLFLATVTVNALANILPINGVGTGALSDELPNLFVPAGVTFSIWGLIYLMLALYVATVLIGAFKKPRATDWGVADGIAFSLNLAANIGWILAWHYRLVALSLAIMLFLLGTLVFLAERKATRAGTKGLRAFLLDAPVAVYLGWICVATIANATALLVKLGWNGLGIDPRLWTIVVIIAGLAVGLGFIIKRKAWIPPLVIVWAYAGIVLKRIQVDKDYSASVWIAALVAAVILLAGVAITLTFGRKKTESA